MKDLRSIIVSKYLEETAQRFYWKIKNSKNFIQQNGNHILLIFSQNQIYNFYLKQIIVIKILPRPRSQRNYLNMVKGEKAVHFNK